ncbi:sigma 54-interacting transcriptional regulator [bacterium]|nr:sigma 54-interacting transcriptional regulator [bacterium]
MLVKSDEVELMSKAALFEDEFSIDWLLELSDLRASRVLAILDANKKSGKLTEERSGMFCFTSDDNRQKLFNVFSEEDKIELHRLAARILIKEPAINRKKAYTLSKHLIHIPNDIEGCRWLITAGDSYAEEVRYQEAITCYTKAIRDLSDSTEKESDRLFVETVYKYMNMFSVKSESEWTTSILKKALERAKAINDQIFLSIINLHLAINQFQRGNFKAAEKYFNTGWKLVPKIENIDFLKLINTLGAYFYYLQGRFSLAVKTYEKSFKGVEQFPETMSLLYAVAAMGRSYAAKGLASQGLGMLDAIRKHCLNINQHQIADWALLQMGYILKGIGRIDDSLQLIAEIDEKTARTYDVRFKEDLLLLKAMLYYWKGKNDKSAGFLRNYLQLIKENEALGIPIASYGFVLKLLWSMEQGTYPPMEGITVKEALDHSISSENVFYKGYGYRYKALLQRRNGEQPQEIIKSLKSSLEFLQQSGHRLPIARTHVELARYYLIMGDEKRAKEEAKKAGSIILSNRSLHFPDDLRYLVKDISVEGNLLDEILQLNQEIITIRNSDEIEKHIILTVIRITGAERGAIFLIKRSDDSIEFTVRAAKNITTEDINSDEFNIPMQIINDTATTGEGIIKDLNREYNGHSHALDKIKSCICVPMIIKNEIVGVMYFDNRFLASAFKKPDLQMFTYFASQAAIAMDNAEAFNEVKWLNKRLRNEKQYYKDQHLERLHADSIIGESKEIKILMNKILRVANTETTVLILGETGVGKELVASTIMDKSMRSDKPFIRVNCSAFSEGLIASELFGHEKGSFTGADKQKAGRFELADGGTLFLDEIGDVPPEVQVRLLRVIQTQEFERVGGTKTLKSNFRLIAATNQDLRELVKRGKFREDLYYRLNVFPITVPALRERRGDIALLAEHFLDVFSKKVGKTFEGIPEEEMKNLTEYDWPGNVRELENVIERGVIMSVGNTFRTPKLASYNQDVVEKSVITLAENEKQHILWALERTSWKISGPGGAAELLDINYGTLRSRMKKNGIRLKKHDMKKR